LSDLVLVVGGTSQLGSRVTRILRSRGTAVRVMTRKPDSTAARSLSSVGAEVVFGDLREPASLAAACGGATAVLASAHAFPGARGNNPHSVDHRGNVALIAAARAAGVRHFVFVSIVGASLEHSVDFFRIKRRIEDEVQRSSLGYTIVRAAAFMESWATIVGEPVLKHGKVTIFGRGDTPINFVSVEDVAAYVAIALDDRRARNRVLEVGGPENLTMNEVVARFEAAGGRPCTKKHVPLTALRVLSKLVRPFNAPLSRLMSTAIFMDTAEQRLDMTEMLKEFPVALLRLDDVIRRIYGPDVGRSA